MSYKPRSRKRTTMVTRRRVATVFVIALLAASVWLAYETFFVKPPPVYARIDTSMGSFEVELFSASAPRTVANFVNLAQSGFYDNLVWHRIIDTPTPFVIQTGDPNTRYGINSTRSTWGRGGSNQTVPLEIDPNLHNYEGYLGMARKDAPDSGTSQFYVNLSNSTSNLSLDGKYTVFGKVISGWNVVESIAKVPIYTTAKDFGQPITPVFVLRIVILKSP